jgi:hypothetical protein
MGWFAINAIHSDDLATHMNRCSGVTAERGWRPDACGQPEKASITRTICAIR